MESLLVKYGYALLFAGVAVEGEAALLAAGLLARHGFFRLPVVILVAVAANTFADQFYFRLARQRGRAWVEKRFGQHRHFQSLMERMGRHAFPLLVVSRFAYGLRIAIPAACGVVGMGTVAFTLVDLAGRRPVGDPHRPPRLLGRGRARAAPRQRAPLRGGDRGRPPRRRGNVARPAPRPARRALARAGLRRRGRGPPRAGAVRGRPDGRPQRALGHLAAGARGRARARAVAAARGDAAQPPVHAVRRRRPPPGHAQPLAPQGARLVGGGGRPRRVDPLPRRPRVRPPPLDGGGAPPRLPARLPAAVPGAQRPGLAAPGAADGARARRAGVGVRRDRPRRPPRPVPLGRGQHPGDRGRPYRPAHHRPRRRPSDRPRRTLPRLAADHGLGRAALPARPRPAARRAAAAAGGAGRGGRAARRRARPLLPLGVRGCRTTSTTSSRPTGGRSSPSRCGAASRSPSATRCARRRTSSARPATSSSTAGATAGRRASTRRRRRRSPRTAPSA